MGAVFLMIAAVLIMVAAMLFMHLIRAPLVNIGGPPAQSPVALLLRRIRVGLLQIEQE